MGVELEGEQNSLSETGRNDSVKLLRQTSFIITIKNGGRTGALSYPLRSPKGQR